MLIQVYPPKASVSLPLDPKRGEATLAWGKGGLIRTTGQKAWHSVYSEPFAFSTVQDASGIDARFLKLSPALTVSPIMTKFSQYNPYSTYYLVLVSICRQD